MLTLGIETSCDETSVAVVDAGRTVRSNIILSQGIHTRFGGVVPEVASREHLKTIVPIYREALDKAGVTLDQIELVAATMGPGLVGPLLVGLSFAKGLAFARSLPFMPVNHLEGHLVANLLAHPELKEHHLTLVVSGGHTMLVEVSGIGEYSILGKTRDDAAGEAFDKVARILDLGYPGGPIIDRLAQKGKNNSIRFPCAELPNSADFSFSGIKTSVLYYARQHKKEKGFSVEKVAYSFQNSVVQVLVHKSIGLCLKKRTKTLLVGGGVAANTGLRSLLDQEAAKHNIKVFYPPIKLCLDNAAMVAGLAFQLSSKKTSSMRQKGKSRVRLYA